MRKVAAFAIVTTLLLGTAATPAAGGPKPSLCTAVLDGTATVATVAGALDEGADAGALLECLSTRAATGFGDWIICPILAALSYYSVAGVIEIGPHGDVWLAVLGLFWDCPPYVGG